MVADDNWQGGYGDAGDGDDKTPIWLGLEEFCECVCVYTELPWRMSMC